MLLCRNGEIILQCKDKRINILVELLFLMLVYVHYISILEFCIMYLISQKLNQRLELQISHGPFMALIVLQLDVMIPTCLGQINS